MEQSGHGLPNSFDSVESQSPLRRPQKDRKESFDYYLAKFIFMCFVLVLAYYFQVIGDTSLKVDSYATDDPKDTERRGGGYTCGCPTDLPVVTENSPYLRQKAANSLFNLNICYEPSALKDMNVLMFSNSSAEQVESIMSSPANAMKPMPGFMIEQQAHAITGPLNTVVRYAPDYLQHDLKTLYPGGNRQSVVGANISYFTSTSFLSFPTDYLRLAFTYNCNNCSACGVEKVNQMFKEVLGTERWGGCFLVDESANECNQTAYSYQAMCTIYQTETVSSTFIVKSFFKEFPKIQKYVSDFSAAIGWGLHWRTGNNNNIALQPSTVYMNHSKVTSSEVLLRFKHVDPQSASWLDLSRFFPSLDSPCSSLHPTTVCTGASLCNLFTRGGSPDIRCLNQTVLSSASSCKKAFENSTLENAGHLCEEMGVTSPSTEDPQCACGYGEQECKQTPPYLATWNNSKYVEGDPMNAFLYSGILKDYWANRSGLCTNKHWKIIPYNPRKNKTASEEAYATETILLKGTCSNSGTRSKGMESGGYCWLTGQYRNFTDLDAGWKQVKDLNIPQFYSDPNSGGRFVCYKVSRQPTLLWILLILGAAFGWAGSVDLICKILEWFRDVYEENKIRKQKSRDVVIV